VNQANYNRNEISVLTIPQPPYIVQVEIAKLTAAVDAKLVVEENRKNAYAALFRPLLHDLMTGRVRVGFSGSAVCGNV